MHGDSTATPTSKVNAMPPPAPFERLKVETGSIEQATVEPHAALERVAKSEAARFARVVVGSGSIEQATVEPHDPASGGRTAKDAALERVAKNEAARFARVVVGSGSIEQATVEPLAPETAGRTVNPLLEKVAKTEAARFARLNVETGSVEQATVEPFAPAKAERSGTDPALQKVPNAGKAGIETRAEPSKVTGAEVASANFEGNPNPEPDEPTAPSRFARFKAALSSVVDRVSDAASRVADTFRRLTGSDPAKVESGAAPANVERASSRPDVSDGGLSAATAHEMSRDDRPVATISHPEVLEAIRAAHAENHDPGQARVMDAGLAR